MQSHIDDAEKYLGMPVVFSEFGVSTKDPGYNISFRDSLISTVYNTVLDSVRKGGGGGGSLVWQVFPDGTEYMDDGYAIFFRNRLQHQTLYLDTPQGSHFSIRCANGNATGGARRSMASMGSTTRMSSKCLHSC